MSSLTQPSFQRRASRVPVAGIEDIPAELLSFIFIKTANILDDDVKSNTSPCMYLSHVCKRWRIVALACQELWSRFLPLPSVDWTNICLSRCPSIALDVAIDSRYMSSDQYREASGLVLMQWDRISHFYLELIIGLDFTDGVGHPSAQSMVLLGEIFDYVAKANDCLCTLHLRLYLLDNPADIWTPVHLPLDTSAFRYPRLVEVELHNCLLPNPRKPPAFFNSTLRTLNISHTKAWDDVDSMIDYLQAIPMLESFSFEFCEESDEPIFDCRPSRIHPPRCISLPHLMDLKLGGFWIHNMTIFNYVSVPSQCYISFESETSLMDSSRTDAVSGDVVLWHITTGTDSLKHHFATAISQGLFYSCAWLASNSVSGHTPCTSEYPTASGVLQPFVALPIPTNTSVRIRKAVLGMAAHLPIFTRATTLQFEKTIWKHIPAYYEAYQSVHELHLVTSRQAEAFIFVLQDRGTTLFPALRRIVLKEINLRTRLSLVRRLVEALCETHASADAGGFDCLALKECPCATEDSVNEIRDLLGAHRVEWDHYVDNSSLGLMREHARQQRLQAGEPLVDSDIDIYDYDTDWDED